MSIATCYVHEIACLLASESQHSTLDPPDGWCSMTLLFGSDFLVPRSPAHSSRDAIEQACPTHNVLTGLRMYCSNNTIGGVHASLCQREATCIETDLPA